MAKDKSKDTFPSVLAFEKKLVPSDAQMFGTVWDRRNEKIPVPLEIQSKSVRGTISNRLSKALQSDPAKLDAEVEKPNLQTVDHCPLPADCDTLRLQFTLKVLSGVQQPSACNSETFRQTFAKAVEDYIKDSQFTDLAERYATNIANARFLWRNRVGAESIEVNVTSGLNDNDRNQWTYDAKSIGLSNFDKPSVQPLSQLVADALCGKREFIFLNVVADAKLGNGQEVYPSEELVQNKDAGKTLYRTDGVAGMHSQKIGNAIRTIDTWYDEDESTRPIAVEAYGAVTNLGIAYRKPKNGTDFYTLFDRFGVGETIESPQDHYVMAMLVRGGVFGKSSK